MKKKYLVIIFLISLFVILLLGTTSYAGTQKLNDLKYDVILNSDGTADVTETWNISVSETNTLFKTFDIDKAKYIDITDVTVEEITRNGTRIPFWNTGEYSYHVDKGGYYALTIPQNRQFEIAWGVSINNTATKTYIIKYKIKDAVDTYNDCSEFYWQFIGNTNEIPAKKVTGTIVLPSGVSNLENLRAWAHGPLDGIIKIVDNKTVSFEINNLNTRTMVEVRIVTTENLFYNNSNYVEIDKFDNIISQERKWVEDANKKREETKKTIRERILLFAFISVIILLVFVFIIIRYKKELSKVKRQNKLKEIPYFREIPEDNATPAEAAFLYYFQNETGFKSNLSKIVSATILDLALKRYISFEQAGKDDIFIIINEEKNKEELKKDEKNVYEMLINVYKYKNKKNNNDMTTKKVSMRDIEKYAKYNDRSFLSKIEEIETIAEQHQELSKNYDKMLIKDSKRWKSKSFRYYVLALYMGIFIIPIMGVIPSIICGSLCKKISVNKRNLTEKGTDEQIKWKGLKRYMEEFSLINEREVPELVLWEKYLVYATAFGIADKVIKQLKMKYPQFADESYMMSDRFVYMSMMNRINFNNTINSGMQRAYSSGINARAVRNYSSSGGFGGGFSGGGRRPVVAEAGMGGR